jgi:ubiquinone/menaquinone biosynthesis C-methylase UbiE
MLSRLHNRSHWRGPGHDRPISGRGSQAYDRLARWVLRGLYRRIAAETAPAIPPGGVVLDVGTGPGLLLVELAARRPDLRITGIDLSTDMIELARRNVRRAGYDDRVEVQAADVAALPFPDAAFDFVVSSLSMHHWGSVPPAMKELARVLRPGGTLWIYDVRTLPDATPAAAFQDAFGTPAHRAVRRGGGVLWRLLARWSVTRPATPGTGPA